MADKEYSGEIIHVKRTIRKEVKQAEAEIYPDLRFVKHRVKKSDRGVLLIVCERGSEQ